ncbi:MAG: hypothetical protein COB08_002965 [Rhodobacteraceae bacterium]|nr:hypothetical protein [Paracoccaceae bacterium]
MQSGTIISAVGHGGLLVVALLGGLDWWQDTLPEPRITKVTLVRAAELDVRSSAAPQMPMAEIAQFSQPEIALDNVEAPSLESAVNQTVIDQTDAPDAADASPDVSALLLPDNPEVVVVAPTVDMMLAPNEAAPELFQPALAGNELNAPVSMSRPPPPRNAPRIDTSAAARPPEDSMPNTENTAEVTDEPGDAVETAVQEAGAPEEATTEITPDGQENVEISANAPQSASRPPRNPRRAHVTIPEPDEDIIDAVAAALQEAQDASQTTPLVVADLTGPERGVIGDVVSQKWNKVNITGLPDFEQYVVRVVVRVDAFGRVDESSVAPIEPENPTGGFETAYRAARSAIIQAGRAGGIPLPEGKFPNGVRLVLRFDPASGEVGFN